MKPNFMGHVDIELKATLPSGEKVQFFTGMVASNLNAKTMLFKKKIGMGIVFHSFSGRMDGPEDIEKYFENKERINFLCLKISAETAQKIYQYYQEYKQQKIYQYYGLSNRPLYKEGAGCSAFAVSFLQVAELMNSEVESAWSYLIKIPTKLIGPPLGKRKVNFFKLLFTYCPWAKSDEEYKEIFFWDPDKMFNWVERKLQYSSSEYQQRQLAGISGIYKDVSSLRPSKMQIWKK